MHPVEHLYYFSNSLLPLVGLMDVTSAVAGFGGLSPFVFLWLFVHLTIAPGAGHSGWEDHFQSDQ